jgi:hypothetical protein
MIVIFQEKTCYLIYSGKIVKCITLGTLKNRKFRVPRKQGAHFLGARAQIQDPWVFSSSA